MLDPLWALWVTLLFGLGSFGFYLMFTEDKIAASFYVYGKSLDLRRKKGIFWKLFLIPKRSFSHFYVSSLVTFSASFVILLAYYAKTPSVREHFEPIQIQLVAFSKLHDVQFQRATNTKSITALLFTILLMLMQSFRRLYESLSISVYSQQSKINLVHYAYGHLFYISAAFSTIIPVLISDSSEELDLAHLLDNLVTKPRALIFILFVYASQQQHKCHKILANLRKDKTGRVISNKHFVPSGGPFEYVACPHFLFELIIYFLIILMQGFENKYWNLILVLVICTQTINGLTELKWYRKNYKDYPKERKAIFPGLL